jgi:hypothetical protein
MIMGQGEHDDRSKSEENANRYKETVCIVYIHHISFLKHLEPLVDVFVDLSLQRCST